MCQDFPTGIKIFVLVILTICTCDLDHLWNWSLSGGICVSQTHLVFQIAVSIKAREIHSKRGQIEDYVGVAMVQVSYLIFFYWFAIDTR